MAALRAQANRAIRWLLVLWAALALVPILNAINIVREYAANHLLIEEWYSMAPLAIAMHDGTFSLSQLFEPVNEHLVVISKLILALHTNLTNFSQTFSQHLNLLMSLFILLGLLQLLWCQKRSAALLALPLMSLLTLNVRQAGNWLIVFQNIFLLSSIAILLIMIILQQAPIGWRALFGAMAVALIGSFSMSIAPILWLAPLPTLWLRGYRSWKHYAVWLIAAAGMTAYAILRVTEPFSTPFQLDQLGLLINFVLGFLGNSFVVQAETELPLAIGLGALGIVFFVANALLLWWRRPEWLASWVGIAAFSVGSGTLTGYGRLFFFTSNQSYPLEHRFVTHSMLFWCALVAISLLNVVVWHTIVWERSKALFKLPIATVVLYLQPFTRWMRRTLYSLNGLVAVVLSYLIIVAQSNTLIPDFRANRDCMLALPSTRDLDCAASLMAGSGWGHFLPVLTRIDQLAVRRLGVFAEHPSVVIRSEALAIPLERLNPGFHFRPSQFGSFFTTYEINGQAHTVFSQHASAESVWDIWFQHITVPTYFETALYVPPPESLDLPIDGVIFRIYIQVKWSDEKKLVFEGRYNPLTDREPIPVRINLEPYLNQRITLWIFLETDIGETPFYDRAMWIEPRIVMELSEESARAKYYPPN